MVFLLTMVKQLACKPVHAQRTQKVMTKSMAKKLEAKSMV